VENNDNEDGKDYDKDYFYHSIDEDVVNELKYRRNYMNKNLR